MIIQKLFQRKLVHNFQKCFISMQNYRKFVENPLCFNKRDVEELQNGFVDDYLKNIRKNHSEIISRDDYYFCQAMSFLSPLKDTLFSEETISKERVNLIIQILLFWEMVGKPSMKLKNYPSFINNDRRFLADYCIYDYKNQYITIQTAESNQIDLAILNSAIYMQNFSQKYENKKRIQISIATDLNNLVFTYHNPENDNFLVSKTYTLIEDKKFDEFNIRLVITILRNLLSSTFIRHSHRDPELITKI